jgi:formylglycine-generating enzyme required for sulfatase activity
MGSDRRYPEEAPVHSVGVDGFWMRKFAVTNDEFGRFVDETGYVTVAERPLDPTDFPGAPPENLVPGSLVFAKTSGPVDLGDLSQWWTWTPGACWRHPEGSRSTLEGRGDHPVVHVAYEDAETYATWAGRELPTESEWELAARGGLDGTIFAWGEEQFPNGQRLANWWQGDFPWRNSLEDGFEGTAPVGSFPPNGFGLHEMTGNVWEWTSDWYAAKHHEDADKLCCIPRNPRGGPVEGSYDPAQPQFRIPRRVLKGGSFLCADNYCQRYRPAARRPQMIDTGMSHIGFRCVARPG